MGTKTKRTPRIAIVLVTILLLNLSSCSPSSKTTDTEKDKPTFTIYVDSESQALIEAGVAKYERLDNPEVTWRLVDKTDLTPKEFEKELQVDLKAGEGPDVIFVNEATAVDPYLQMNV